MFEDTKETFGNLNSQDRPCNGQEEFEDTKETFGNLKLKDKPYNNQKRQISKQWSAKH